MGCRDVSAGVRMKRPTEADLEWRSTGRSGEGVVGGRATVRQGGECRRCSVTLAGGGHQTLTIFMWPAHSLRCLQRQDGPFRFG